MPIYEYVCEKCGHQFENLQRTNDPAPAECPACNSAKLHRVVSRSSFQLKGGGWYSDLYGSVKKDASAPVTKPTVDSKSTTASADTKAASASEGTASSASASKSTPSTPAADKS